MAPNRTATPTAYATCPSLVDRSVFITGGACTAQSFLVDGGRF
jgi:hypothetical protein